MDFVKEVEYINLISIEYSPSTPKYLLKTILEDFSTMATATLLLLYCVKEATGTDLSVIEAIASLPEKVVPSGFGFSNVLDAIRSLPGIIAAIDMARSDPDNLYITTSTEGDINNSIWPGSGNTQDFQADQSASPQVAIDFSYSLNISL